MRWFLSRFLVLFSLVLMSAPHATAGEGQPSPAHSESAAEDWVINRIIGSGSQLQRISQLKQKADRLFLEQDLDGGGLSSSDYALQQERKAAHRRSETMGSFFRDDLDGNGRVTRAEVERSWLSQSRQSFNVQNVPLEPTAEQIAKVLETKVGEKFKFDSDNDSVLSFDEILEASKGNGENRKDHFPDSLRIPVEFDADKNGTIARAEFDAVVDRVLAELDSNGDGKFDADESIVAEGARRRAMQTEADRQRIKAEADAAQERVKSCSMPPAQPNDRIIVVSASKLAGTAKAMEPETGGAPAAAVVHVEAGEQPLYLIAISHGPHIWKLTGATDRIRTMFVSGGTSASRDKSIAGVAGLPEAKVRFEAKRNCFHAIQIRSSHARATAKASFRAMLGRDPDDIIATDSLWRVDLPSGIATEEPPDGKDQLEFNAARKDQEAWAAFRKDPDPVILDLDRVPIVGSVSMAPAAVTPGQKGLLDLLDSGMLEVAEWTKVHALGRDRVVLPGYAEPRVNKDGSITIDGINIVGVPPRKLDGSMGFDAGNSYRQPALYRILKDAVLPPQVLSQDAVRYVLPKGIAMPTIAGRPAKETSVCIMSEETGEGLTMAQHCRLRN